MQRGLLAELRFEQVGDVVDDVAPPARMAGPFTQPPWQASASTKTSGPEAGSAIRQTRSMLARPDAARNAVLPRLGHAVGDVD